MVSSLSSSSSSSITSCQIFFSTQSGRAKSCARRSARIIREHTTVQLLDGIGSPFDETRVPFLESISNSSDNTLFLMFVSTTGDGEHCDSIRNTWKILLQKSLPSHILIGKKFALFCLGDRAYGPQFCAAGRKLAVRLLQLGMTSSCEVGYGDDNTPNGGVFRDLDDWLDQKLLRLPGFSERKINLGNNSTNDTTISCPFQVFIEEAQSTDPITSSTDQDEKRQQEEPEEEWQNDFFEDSYRDYFNRAGPVTAYSYNSCGERIITENNNNEIIKCGSRNAESTLLVGTVILNKRITASDWKQDTRHLEVEIVKSQLTTKDNNNVNTSDANGISNICELPYVAGDVASILPFNSREDVDRFLTVLPESLSSLADSPIRVDVDEYLMDNRYTRWPRRCTLRGWLTNCADIQSLPEREDLRVLSGYCSPRHHSHHDGLDQGKKLRSLSETSEAALYGDYILREKRSWIDVLYDFESLRDPGSLLTMEALLMFLPPMRTRDFSIASAPSMTKLLRKWEVDDDQTFKNDSFSIELCVAVVEGTTRLGRDYHGLCSRFLSRIGLYYSIDGSFSKPSAKVRIWIRPGTFGKMPMHLINPSSFQIPIICVGAGTGIAPMRSLLLERIAVRSLAMEDKNDTNNDSKTEEKTSQIVLMNRNENILVFGCRKQEADYYYKEEWKTLNKENNIRILTAFSQDQIRKMYVQKILRQADDGALIAKHMLERKGCVYIAGGPKMARCVKQEIIEVLSELLGGEKQATKFLNKMQRIGRFNIEAWS